MNTLEFKGINLNDPNDYEQNTKFRLKQHLKFFLGAEQKKVPWLRWDANMRRNSVDDRVTNQLAFGTDASVMSRQDKERVKNADSFWR